MTPVLHHNVCVELVEQFEQLQAKLDALRQMGEIAMGEDIGSVAIQPEDEARLADLRDKLNQYCPAYPQRT